MTMVARHDDGVVAVADALHEAAAQPADGEHGLHHHRAGERVGRHRPYAGDDGRRGVFERVPEQHRPLRARPGRAGRAQGGALSALQHGGPRQPRHIRRRVERQRDDRQEHAAAPAPTRRRTSPASGRTPAKAASPPRSPASPPAAWRRGAPRGRPPARAEPPPDSPAPRPAAGRQAARARPAAPKRRKRRTPFPKRRARSSARCRNPRAGRCPDRAGTARARSCPDESG